jgi:hypothetical protein
MLSQHECLTWPHNESAFNSFKNNFNQCFGGLLLFSPFCYFCLASAMCHNSFVARVSQWATNMNYVPKLIWCSNPAFKVVLLSILMTLKTALSQQNFPKCIYNPFTAMGFWFQLDNTKREALLESHCDNGSCRYVRALTLNPKLTN